VASVPTLVPEDVFSDLPEALREELLDAFSKIVTNYSERRWEPAELNGGKLCEVVYSIIRGIADKKFPARASKPQSMMGACRALENDTSIVARSIRFQIPRMIPALYELRNNRNVGHVGGEVDPNHMDAVCVLQMSKWMLAELIRILHHRPLDEAAEIVDALVERETPLLWKVNGKVRVLETGLTMKGKMLLILHANAAPVTDRDLIDFVEHSNPSAFRRDVLRPAHKDRLVEYDQQTGMVTISPKGIERAEKMLAERIAV
jgi:hypothetical protein